MSDIYRVDSNLGIIRSKALSCDLCLYNMLYYIYIFALFDETVL